ncbi:hypothetical protein D1BOALGB6SA_8819 [Olavius sp. associated proteobacterium Delta 1]|nr:hypothetical protein D1BOALGB6SA_8819 [Olavius sp. associated proteobacterium Delta 1]
MVRYSSDYIGFWGGHRYPPNEAEMDQALDIIEECISEIE